MGVERTYWHVGFFRLLEQRRPAAFDLTAEHSLAKLPQRADVLVVRRRDDGSDSEARVLRGLWPRIQRDAILEYKSPSAGYASRDLVVLLGYGAQHFVDEPERIRTRDDLLLAMIVPRITATLRNDFALLGATLLPLGEGYFEANGLVFSTLVVELDGVAEGERDDLIGAFGSSNVLDGDDSAWWYNMLSVKQENATMEDLPGYNEMVRKFIATRPGKEWLAELPIEERLAGVPTGARLAGLDIAHAVLENPVEVLRVLPADFIATLPADVQAEIRRRLGA